MYMFALTFDRYIACFIKRLDIGDIFFFWIFVCFTCNITMFTFCLYHYDSKTLLLGVLINVFCI